jgi:hypothetical protein
VITYKSMDILAPRLPVQPLSRPFDVPSALYRKRVPRYVTVIVSIALLINAILLALQGLVLAVAVFTASIPVGLALFLTGIGLVVLAPAGMALLAIRQFSRLKTARSRTQFWLKPAGYFMAGLALPWVTLIAVAVIVDLLLRLLTLGLR